jgi:hypothetical protein
MVAPAPTAAAPLIDPFRKFLRSTGVPSVPAGTCTGLIRYKLPNNGAGDRNRTRDLLITNQLLYLLSYASLNPFFNIPDRFG